MTADAATPDPRTQEEQKMNAHIRDDAATEVRSLLALRSPSRSNSSSERDLTDVLTISLPGCRSRLLDKRQLVFGEADRDHFAARVVGLRSAGAGCHATTLTYTRKFALGVASHDFSVYDKYMNTTSYMATSQDGRTYSTTSVTDAEQAAFADMVEKFFAEGVARFGSVAAFQNALEAAV